VAAMRVSGPSFCCSRTGQVALSGQLVLDILGHGVEVQISLPGDEQIGLQVLRQDLVQDLVGVPSGTARRACQYRRLPFLGAAGKAANLGG